MGTTSSLPNKHGFYPCTMHTNCWEYDSQTDDMSACGCVYLHSTWIIGKAPKEKERQAKDQETIQSLRTCRRWHSNCTSCPCDVVVPYHHKICPSLLWHKVPSSCYYKYIFWGPTKLHSRHSTAICICWQFTALQLYTCDFGCSGLPSKEAHNCLKGTGDTPKAQELYE
jgi:hypothetical protein